MTRSLLFIATICMLFSCKKTPVEPAPQNPPENTTINLHPKKSITTEPNISGSTVHEFSYYPNNLVKTIVKYNTFYWPMSFDSTIFFYNANNQVVNKKKYVNNTLIEDTYNTYNASNKIVHVKIQYSMWLAEYTYHYNNTSDELEYILTYQNSVIQAQDSTTINENTITTYKYRSGIDPEETLQNGYAVWGTATYYPSSNGIHHTVPTCLTKSIDFQTEVAECFIEIGETNVLIGNYFYIPTPRKFASIADGKNYTYTFDQNNRLTKIDGEFPNYAPSGSQIPGIISTTVYY
jgi:hypothetical protein